jgi:hypothetical protein
MVAALVLLDDKLAFNTLPVMQVFLKEFQLSLVALPLVGLQQTFRTELCQTCAADHFVFSIFSHFYHTFALLLRAKLERWVLGGEVELVKFFVIFLNVSWQTSEEICSCVQQLGTALMGAVHFFKSLYFVDHVMMQA